MPYAANVGELARDLRVRIPVRPESSPLLERGRNWLAGTAAMAIALGGPAGIYFIATHELTEPGTSATPLLYLLPVIAATLLGGLLPAIVAAAASVGAIVYGRLVPAASFQLDPAADVVPAGVFLLVALVLSHSLSRERVRRAQLADAQDRLAFIARASELLNETALDYRRTLTELAGLAVPHLGDVCIVDVLDDAGQITTVVVAHDDDVDAVRADSLLSQPPPAGEESGAPAVAASGRSEIYPRVDDATLERVATNPEHLNLLRGLRVRSLMIVPLRSPRHVFGAITLGTVAMRTRYSPRELALAEDIGTRAGTALENVALYMERSHEAQMLQRSLLPADIPQIPGAEVVVRFRPQGHTYLVGGDFYDVFGIDDRTWGVAVGDVCGKGIEAAALTGLARHTLRVGAIRERAPSRVLGVLNEALVRQGADRYCTAVYARFELRDDGRASLTVCTGGHPLPILLRATGEVAQLGTPGTLLGVFDDPDLADRSYLLEPGDTVIMYTDGLLDERLPAPEERLCALVASLAGTETAALAQIVEEASIDRDPPPDDDVAMVVVGMAPSRTVRLPSHYEHEPAAALEETHGHLRT